MTDLFWLSDEQFARLAPLLPTDPRGVPRVDERRVISGIVQVLRSGGRAGWMPHRSTARARPSTTVSCAGRHAASGARSLRRSPVLAAHRLFCCLIPRTPRPIAAHPAVKGGRSAGHRALTRRTHHQDPHGGRRAWPAGRGRAKSRPARRCARGAGPHRQPAGAPSVSGGCGLRQRRVAPFAQRAWHSSGDPQQSDTPAQTPVRSRLVPQPQPDRAHDLPSQGLPARGNTL